METCEFNVTDKEQTGMRVGKLLPELNNDWSRNQIQDRIRADLVVVNDKVVKSNYKVKLNDHIVVTEKEVVEVDILPGNLNLDIYYEDDDATVVYKPRGMVVRPSPGHYTSTLANGLMYQIRSLSDISGEIRPGIVHRVDMDTSDLLMVTKNDIARRGLVEQLVGKSVKRKYIALIHGSIPHDYGTINAPTGRNKNDRQSMAAVDDDKEAVTHFNILEHFKDCTFVECQLETGRTYQIRVHMKYVGFPLVGDPKYGPKETLDIGGQALHTGFIGFEYLITGEYTERHAELPQDFGDLLDTIRKRGAQLCRAVITMTLLCEL